RIGGRVGRCVRTCVRGGVGRSVSWRAGWGIGRSVRGDGRRRGRLRERPIGQRPDVSAPRAGEGRKGGEAPVYCHVPHHHVGHTCVEAIPCRRCSRDVV